MQVFLVGAPYVNGAAPTLPLEMPIAGTWVIVQRNELAQYRAFGGTNDKRKRKH